MGVGSKPDGRSVGSVAAGSSDQVGIERWVVEGGKSRHVSLNSYGKILEPLGRTEIIRDDPGAHELAKDADAWICLLRKAYDTTVSLLLNVLSQVVALSTGRVCDLRLAVVAIVGDDVESVGVGEAIEPV